MSYLRILMARISGMFRDRGASDNELREELEAHLEMQIAENVRRGMSLGDARRAALVAAGGMSSAAESVSEQRGLPVLETIAADARFALRTLRRSPAYTLV